MQLCLLWERDLRSVRKILGSACTRAYSLVTWELVHRILRHLAGCSEDEADVGDRWKMLRVVGLQFRVTSSQDQKQVVLRNLS